MSRTIAKNKVLSVLEKRFDFQSARSVMEKISKQSHLGGKDDFTLSELETLCVTLEETSTHVTSIAELIRKLGEPPVTEKKAAAKKPDAEKPKSKASKK